jgi:hypothetical protein
LSGLDDLIQYQYHERRTEAQNKWQQQEYGLFSQYARLRRGAIGLNKKLLKRLRDTSAKRHKFGISKRKRKDHREQGPERYP